MIAYSGHTSRGQKMTRFLQERGIGEMWTAGQDKWPPHRTPWAMDCGTFGPWRNGREWKEKPFMDAVHAAISAEMWNDFPAPEFLVAPDIIGGGHKSLALSLEWRVRLPGFPVYLAVQDGMRPHQVKRVLHRFDGVFVGGTLRWKIKTAAHWVELAHDHRKPCHIGRVGIPRRVRWAARIGADSIDSCQPLWTKAYLKAWLEALQTQHPQGELTWSKSQ